MLLSLVCALYSDSILELTSLTSTSFFCSCLACSVFMYARKVVQTKLQMLTYITRFLSGIKPKLIVCRMGHIQMATCREVASH